MIPKTKKELFEYIFELDDRLTKMIQESIPAEKKKNIDIQITKNNI